MDKLSYDQQVEIAEVFKTVYLQEVNKVNKAKEILYFLINRKDMPITDAELIQIIMELE